MTARRSGLARLVLASLVASASVLALAAAGGCSADEAPAAEEEGVDAGDPDTARPTFDTGPERVNGPTVECAIGAAIESEPNDTPPTATPFSELAICGVLATAKDVDYLTFDTPPGTTLTVFQAVIDGPVDFELTLGGATFGPSETSKFGPGTYLVKAFSKGDKAGTYRIRVQFE
jgi:hypothetical protein